MRPLLSTMTVKKDEGLKIRELNDKLYIDIVLALGVINHLRMRPSVLDMQLIEKTASILEQVWVEGGMDSSKNPNRYLKWGVKGIPPFDRALPPAIAGQTLSGKRQGALWWYPKFQDAVVTSIALPQSPYSVTTEAGWKQLNDAESLIKEIGSNPRPGIEIDLDNIKTLLQKTKDLRYSVWNKLNHAEYFISKSTNPLPPITGTGTNTQGQAIRPDTGIGTWFNLGALLQKAIDTVKGVRATAIEATTDRIVQESVEETIQQAEEADLTTPPPVPLQSRPEILLLAGGAVLALVVLLKRRR